MRERKGKKIQDDNGWVIYDQLQPNAHANLKLFRKIALCCHVNFTFNPNLSCKGGGISEKLLKYWTCVKFPNLDCYFMLFSLSHSLARFMLLLLLLLLASSSSWLLSACIFVCFFGVSSSHIASLLQCVALLAQRLRQHLLIFINFTRLIYW